MIGRVDSFGRALVDITIRSADTCQEIQVWIDTGFNGDLVLPQDLIFELQLPDLGSIKAVLADGSEVTLQRYMCQIDWCGEWRDLEVIANEGLYPLLGVGLLLGLDLHISYRSGEITIE